jgi:superfamily II DNA or RNA helicase
MENIKISKLDEVFLKLEVSRHQAKELKEFFVCKAPNFMFHPMYKSGVWNGNLYYFNSANQTLPIGLLPKLIKFCEQYGYTFSFDFDVKQFGDNVTEEFLDKFYEYIFPPSANIYPRDYQQEAIHSILKNGRCVATLATGSGKCCSDKTMVDIEIDDELYNKLFSNTKHKVVCKVNHLIKISIAELTKALNIKHDNSEELVHKISYDIKIKNHEDNYVPFYAMVTKTLDSYETKFDNDMSIITSNEHLILTDSGCKKIKDITDENIYNSFSETNYVKKIETNLYKEKDTLYDFCMEPPHLFKSSDGFVHHNSLIQYSLIRYYLARNEKILLLVPNVSLVEQMYSDFKEYGWDNIEEHVDKLYSGQKTSDKKVLISTWQSIYKRDVNFFNKFGTVVIDECHLSSGQSIKEISEKCTNAKYRIGLTATMPKEEANVMTIQGYLGPICYELKAKELMDRDVLSKLEIRNLLMKYPENMKCHRPSYQQEISDILSYSERNKAIEYIIDRAADGQNSLILLHRIEHLKIVKEYLEKNFPNHIVYDIYGDTLPQRREEIRKKIELEGNVILVSTFSSLSTGINIKKLHNIIFFASYKSMIKILQSIGRGLRKHDTKEFVTVWDCVDDLRYREGNKLIKNYCFKHWEQRKEYYLEQEFTFRDESIVI